MSVIEDQPKSSQRQERKLTSYKDDPTKLERVRQEAKRQHISMGEFIRRATEEALVRAENGTKC